MECPGFSVILGQIEFGVRSTATGGGRGRRGAETKGGKEKGKEREREREAGQEESKRKRKERKRTEKGMTGTRNSGWLGRSEGRGSTRFGPICPIAFPAYQRAL